MAARRTPVQPRAEERRRSLLDAAARLLAEKGYDAINTNSIAAEAGASVGTVYQYFPNKIVILQALLERFQGRLSEALMGALGSGSLDDLDAATERVVRAFAHFYQREPGYAELWLGSQLIGPLSQVGQAWGGEFSEVFGQILRARAGLEQANARCAARALVHAISSVVTVALTGPEDDRERMIDEAVAMARSYLAHITGSRPKPPAC